MPQKRCLVTGSSGLVGSEMAVFFRGNGFEVHGFDNNQRADFFGAAGDTRWNQRRLQAEVPDFNHHELDVRDRAGVLALVDRVRPDVILHCAAQPSHDRAADFPFENFDVNAVGTLNLLEAARRSCPESPFVFMSSNKVYGDVPNRLPLRESERRFDFADPAHAGGVGEDMSIDRSLHSLFGASKVAADVLVQEYGRYFNMPTCCLRGGCLTGPNHSGVEHHGFLSYLVKCNLEGREYRIYGYGGKQVRDNIHVRDVAAFALAFARSPRAGEAYNIGGGRANSCSIWEAFELAERFSGRSQVHTYVDQARVGDHICYYSDLSKIRSHYPSWGLTLSLEDCVREIVEAWELRLA